MMYHESTTAAGRYRPVPLPVTAGYGRWPRAHGNAGDTFVQRGGRRFLTGAAALLLAAMGTPMTASADPAALAESARCTMCHHAEAQRVGPSWAAIAERYAGDDGALATLTSRARAGGSGEWGKAPMPPVSEAQLSDADLEAVLTWVLDR